ncbi:hypothetical protein [Nocardia sp. NPDC051981]|uniref:hypothetical protein n=1 Tax=Nocardia sp. NPDC051981 TaxID=3155417 RepID=UPI003422178B
MDAVADPILLRDSKYLRAPANDPAAQPIITLTPGAWIPFLHNILDESGHDTDDENHTTYPSIEPQPGGDGRRTRRQRAPGTPGHDAAGRGPGRRRVLAGERDATASEPSGDEAVQPSTGAPRLIGFRT